MLFFHDLNSGGCTACGLPNPLAILFDLLVLCTTTAVESEEIFAWAQIQTTDDPFLRVLVYVFTCRATREASHRVKTRELLACAFGTALL